MCRCRTGIKKMCVCVGKDDTLSFETSTGRLCVLMLCRDQTVTVRQQRAAISNVNGGRRGRRSRGGG